MQRQMLNSKIHRATVTACGPDYGNAHNRTIGVNADTETLLEEVPT